jgi:hypothetical protein
MHTLHSNGGLLGFLDHLAALAYAVFVVGGLIGLAIRPSRRVCGYALYLSSFAIGLDVWFWSLTVVLHLWGIVWVVIGLVLAGVGVVPMAIIATLLHGEWLILGYLVINLIIVFLCRLAGASMIASAKLRSTAGS